MAFLGIGKKKKSAPAELPDLISDELEKESNEKLNSFLKEEESKTLPSKKEESEKVHVSEKKEFIRDEKTNTNVVNRLVKGVEETKERPAKIHSVNKSFFGELQKNISKELSDLENLDQWYDEKFSSTKVLDDMKDYWKKQKKENLLEILGQDFKRKIDEKISRLQNVEKKWQSIYFDLIEVEEEIKVEEKELRDLLGEFAKICKNKKEIKGEEDSNVGRKNEIKEE